MVKKITITTEVDADGCPFCGSYDLGFGAVGEDGVSVFLQCQKCYGNGPFSEDKEEAVKGWNRRKQP
jgi:Lar family restriction alleviation protein